MSFLCYWLPAGFADMLRQQREQNSFRAHAKSWWQCKLSLKSFRKEFAINNILVNFLRSFCFFLEVFAWSGRKMDLRWSQAVLFNATCFFASQTKSSIAISSFLSSTDLRLISVLRNYWRTFSIGIIFGVVAAAIFRKFRVSGKFWKA